MRILRFIRDYLLSPELVVLFLIAILVYFNCTENTNVSNDVYNVYEKESWDPVLVRAIAKD